MRIKTPSAHVPNTSGQGFTRKAYQVARQLGFKGTGTPGFNAKFMLRPPKIQNRHYGKSGPIGSPPPQAGPENVSFGDTMDPPNETGMFPSELK